MKPEDSVSHYLQEIETIAKTISQEDINKAIAILFDAWKNGKQIFTAGNGGSSSTAIHLTCDLNKFTVVEGKKRFKAICLNDNIPLVSALTNDLGWESVYLEQLKNLMQPGDVYLPISVHGGSGSDVAGLWSQNILKAAKYVQDHGGKVVGMAGFDGGALKKMADACIVVPANSTPLVEGFHSVLAHLICAILRELVSEG
jgi:D-sedoheptulose 7-phosphate isomerase